VANDPRSAPVRPTTAARAARLVRPHSPLAESDKRVELGATPLFHSHLFDDSTLLLEEDLRIASALLDRGRGLDVILEVERW
jgi:fructose/tagatose bisphosphate aldolase